MLIILKAIKYTQAKTKISSNILLKVQTKPPQLPQKNNKPYSSLQHQIYKYYLIEENKNKNPYSYNDAYCSGSQYEQYPLKKLIQMGIKRIQSKQQNFDNEKFDINFNLSGEKYVQSSSIEDSIKCYYLLNHQNAKNHNFSKFLVNKVTRIISSQINLMTNQEMFMLFQSINVKNGLKSVKLQESILQKLLKMAKLSQKQTINWLRVTATKSYLSMRDPMIYSQQKNIQVFTYLINNLKKIPKLQEDNIKQLQQIMVFLRLKSLFLPIQLKFQYQKLIQILAKYCFKNINQIIIDECSLLCGFIDTSQFNNIQVSALKNYTIKKFYLNRLIQNWNFKKMQNEQIKSRYYQLRFQKQQILKDFHIIYNLILMEIGLQTDINNQILFHALQSINYIPYGMEWLVKYYSILKKNKMDELLQNSVKLNKQKRNTMIQFQRKQILKNPNIEEIRKWTISLRQLNLVVCPYIEQNYRMGHLIDFNKKLVIHCYKQDQLVSKQQTIPSKINKLESTYWRMRGWTYLGIHPQKFNNLSLTQRVQYVRNYSQKPIQYTQQKYQLI